MTSGKVKKEKQRKISREEKAKREAKIKEDMKHPVNQFMNKVNDEGKLLYPMAAKLREYFLVNPDPAINAMQMANALLHEIRWHKQTAKEYYQAHLTKKGEATNMFDNKGKLMTHEACYTAYIQESQLCHTVVSKLRTHIINALLPVVDNDIFTFEKFNDYCLGVEESLDKLGYVLFPVKVDVIKAL